MYVSYAGQRREAYIQMELGEKVRLYLAGRGSIVINKELIEVEDANQTTRKSATEIEGQAQEGNCSFCQED